ncbi:hypothetical protein Taro_034342, partial [Colocasia esculenta]|nr:hypothetical protein [Colocasia esculenta]
LLLRDARPPSPPTSAPFIAPSSQYPCSVLVFDTPPSPTSSLIRCSVHKPALMAMMSTSMVRVSSRKEVAGRGEEAVKECMDWYAWLSRTRLDPALVYEYALVFCRNELEEEDVVHFDHEFLLSMGVSVAKHRLEILKLAGEERRRWRRLGRPRPVARLLAAADRTRRCLARCLRSLSAGVGGGGGEAGSTALVPVRRRSPSALGGGGQWGSRKLAALKQVRLLLTDGKERTWYSRWGSRKDKVRDSGGEAGEVRWDSMFQDLKPT